METPLILKTLQGEKTENIPVWFMRQAGRYLPEYQAIRKDFSNFLEFCYTPEAACTVTLQPIERFGFDAAILFCDILVIPDALGQKVEFVKGEGPKLEAIISPEQLEQLSLERVEPHLATVQESIRLIRKELSDDKALIGFSGSPWTLACYMIEGQGSREFQKARQFAIAHPEHFSTLLSLLEQAIARYCCMQIEAGAQVIQLFDSWASVVPSAYFNNWVTAPTQRIISAIKKHNPDIPIIGFAKGAAANLPDYATAGMDALGIDQQQPLAWAKENSGGKILQGNLDNVTLEASKNMAVAHTKNILKQWSDIPFIFNLGHGILQTTPIDHVEAVIETVRECKRDV